MLFEKDSWGGRGGRDPGSPRDLDEHHADQAVRQRLWRRSMSLLASSTSVTSHTLVLHLLAGSALCSSSPLAGPRPTSRSLSKLLQVIFLLTYSNCIYPHPNSKLSQQRPCSRAFRTVFVRRGIYCSQVLTQPLNASAAHSSSIFAAWSKPCSPLRMTNLKFRPGSSSLSASYSFKLPSTETTESSLPCHTRAPPRGKRAPSSSRSTGKRPR